MTSTHAANAVAHFDIAGPDLDALGHFYRSVLGWEPLPQGPGYTLLRTPDEGPNGALNEADLPAVTIGVAVDGSRPGGCCGERERRQRRDAADRQRMGGQGAGTRPGRQPAHADRALNEARLNELLRALAHEERRRILQACLVEAQTAGDLAAASGLAPASVSEHLKVLRKTGLVVLERQGRFRLYRTERSCVLAVAGAVEQLVSL